MDDILIVFVSVETGKKPTVDEPSTAKIIASVQATAVETGARLEHLSLAGSLYIMLFVDVLIKSYIIYTLL